MFKKKMMCLWLFVAILSLSRFTFAGDLEPSAPPAPTMKTLDEIPPTWSQKLPAADRFELVLDGAAVLDKETGLVWEQSPYLYPRSWYQAITDCFGKEVGGRKGWRLPTVEQLASLLDSTQTNPALPSGHLFSNSVQLNWYWSATTVAYAAGVVANDAWVVAFDASGGVASTTKASDYYIWCVRGGQSHDGY